MLSAEICQTEEPDHTVNVGRSIGAALVDEDSTSSCAKAEPAKTAEAQSAFATALFNLMVDCSEQLLRERRKQEEKTGEEVNYVTKSVIEL
jgi:hypothetical protein